MAENPVKRLGAGRQCQSIGGGAGANEKDFGINPEGLAHQVGSMGGVFILTITRHMADVCLGEGFFDFRTHARLVVARKLPTWFHATYPGADVRLLASTAAMPHHGIMVNHVLARSTLLLARLGTHPQGVTLHALAAESGVPPSTCVRLLRDLVALGWADQHGPRGTYHLGPRVASLAHKQPYREALVDAARAVVAETANRYRAQVLVVVLRGERRLVLLRSEADQGSDPLCLVEERELYASASGRLLLANLDLRARRRLVTAIGMPGPASWPGVLSWAEINSECAVLRKAGIEINRPRDSDKNAIAITIPDGAGGNAVLAIGMPKRGWDENLVLHMARDAAQQIQQQIIAAKR